MSGQSVLVDTNILIYLLRGHRTAAEILFDKKLFISFISEIELLSFRKASAQEQKLVDGILSDSRVIHSNSSIVQIAISFRREEGLKLPDAIIAATAAYLRVPLITADKKNLTIKNLEVIEYQP